MLRLTETNTNYTFISIWNNEMTNIFFSPPHDPGLAWDGWRQGQWLSYMPSFATAAALQVLRIYQLYLSHSALSMDHHCPPLVGKSNGREIQESYFLAFLGSIFVPPSFSLSGLSHFQFLLPLCLFLAFNQFSEQFLHSQSSRSYTLFYEMFAYCNSKCWDKKISFPP